MCGISAILLHPQQRSESTWQNIRDSFTGNLLFNEERGKSATGIAIVQENGQVRLYKKALPACEFVQTPEYQALMDSIGATTLLILGHTRMPTKGDPAYEWNNHPIQAGPVFGVHNGQIKNDDALFCQLGFSRQAEVDSEIIFQILAASSSQVEPRQYLENIRDHLRLLEGQFTFLSVDCRAPNRLLVLKHDNPLCAHYHGEWNALIFSSRYIYLRKTFGQALITEALDQNRLLLFDAFSIDQFRSKPAVELAFFGQE